MSEAARIGSEIKRNSRKAVPYAVYVCTSPPSAARFCFFLPQKTAPKDTRTLPLNVCGAIPIAHSLYIGDTRELQRSSADIWLRRRPHTRARPRVRPHRSTNRGAQRLATVAAGAVGSTSNVAGGRGRDGAGDGALAYSISSLTRYSSSVEYSLTRSSLQPAAAHAFTLAALRSSSGRANAEVRAVYSTSKRDSNLLASAWSTLGTTGLTLQRNGQVAPPVR